MESNYLVVSRFGDIYNIHTELQYNTHLMRLIKPLNGHKYPQMQQRISCTYS